MAFNGFQKWAEDTSDKFTAEVVSAVKASLPPGETLGAVLVHQPDFKGATQEQDAKTKGLGYAHRVFAISDRQVRQFEVKGRGITGRKNLKVVGEEIIPFHLVTSVDKKAEPKSIMNSNPLGHLRIQLTDGRKIALRALASHAHRFGGMLQNAISDANAPARVAPSTMSGADELLKWKGLLDTGIITPQEFAQKKQELLR
jgi:hypothetical protein